MVLEDLGINNVPSINITGFFSNTWFYVLLVTIVGVFLLVGFLIFLFMITYNKKVVIFENIAGQGYQPILKTKARIIKLGIGGAELLKTLKGGHFLSAYGRKMGRNTYWYAKGQDGYLYNIIIGDLDEKKGMLDIDPIDRDIRMFHLAIDRLSHQTYGKNSFLEKYGIHLLLFVFLIVLILGMWFIVGKIGEAVAPLSEVSKNSLEVQKANSEVLLRLDALLRAMGYVIEDGGSGLVPAP